MILPLDVYVLNRGPKVCCDRLAVVLSIEPYPPLAWLIPYPVTDWLVRYGIIRLMLTRAVTLTVRLLRLAPVNVRTSVKWANGRGLCFILMILVSLVLGLVTIVRTSKLPLLESRRPLFVPSCTVRMVRCPTRVGRASP